MPTSPARSNRRRWRISAKIASLAFNAAIMVLAFVQIKQWFNNLQNPEDGQCYDASRDIAQFAPLLLEYKIDNGSYPTTKEGLVALRLRPPNLPNWQGPYLKSQLEPDPWGNAYNYESPGPSGEDFLITSYGADGVPGGDGNDADITNQ